MRGLCLALLTSIVVAPACAARQPAQTQAAPQATSAPADVASPRINVTMPQDDAELLVNGEKVDGSGTYRIVDTRTIGKDVRGNATVVALWKPNGYTEMTRTKDVQLAAGGPVSVDLSSADPNDRVKVIYVPTPQDVSEEMARLAGVGPTDVVYEPGCGDARITIAAMRQGAKRAICIDIDKERADESRENVEAAGLGHVIDVRHGDALDLKDLSQVTVVFLYMGEHFNLLIRPVLWRDLPVGSRIVSHQFTMGDWTPDRTVSFASASNGEFQLHLWTITEEVKKRGASSAAAAR